MKLLVNTKRWMHDFSRCTSVSREWHAVVLSCALGCLAIVICEVVIPANHDGTRKLEMSPELHPSNGTSCGSVPFFPEVPSIEMPRS